MSDSEITYLNARIEALQKKNDDLTNRLKSVKLHLGNLDTEKMPKDYEALIELCIDISKNIEG